MNVRIIIAATLLCLSWCSTFDVQVTSTCTNFTNNTCVSWSQTGSIIEQQAACLPGDAEVITPDGPKRMDELVVGDLVLGHDDGRDVYTPVTAWFHRSTNSVT